MYDEAVLIGHGGTAKRPSWKPLERFLPLKLCTRFMWMHALVLENGSKLQAYKHSDTRRYLMIDGNGDSWERLGDARYRRMRHSDAIEQVFPSWWLLNIATEEERIALEEAFRASHARGNGDEAAGAHILPSSPACPFRTLPGPADDW